MLYLGYGQQIQYYLFVTHFDDVSKVQTMLPSALIGSSLLAIRNKDKIKKIVVISWHTDCV